MGFQVTIICSAMLLRTWVLCPLALSFFLSFDCRNWGSPDVPRESAWISAILEYIWQSYKQCALVSCVLPELPSQPLARVSEVASHVRNFFYPITMSMESPLRGISPGDLADKPRSPAAGGFHSWATKWSPVSWVEGVEFLSGQHSDPGIKPWSLGCRRFLHPRAKPLIG